MNDFKLNHNSSVFLDVVRGVSSQLVVIGHAISFLAIFPYLQPPNFPFMQNIAVLIFFILSGFLITFSLMKKPNYSFSEYFIDRFSRIYSGLVPSILFVLFVDLLSISINPQGYKFYNGFDVVTFFSNLFMLEDFPGQALVLNETITSFGSGRTFWTLAVEWWMYMSFGYLLIKILRKNKLTITSGLIFLALSIVPLYNIMYGRGNGLAVYWLLGVLIYLLLPQLRAANMSRRLIFYLMGLFLILAVGRIVAIILKDFPYVEYDPIFAILLMLTLLFAIEYFSKVHFTPRASKVIRFIADYSFTLYLVHYSVLAFMMSNFDTQESPYVYFIIAFIIANVFAASLAYFTEMKHRALRNKLKTLFIKNKDKI